MPVNLDVNDIGPELLVDLRLPPEPTSPARARHALNPLEERFGEETLFTLRLLLSELVTNSIRHAELDAADRIVVRVMCEPGSLRVEVLDAGRSPDPPAMMQSGGWLYQRLGGAAHQGGWGLAMVESLADSWGIDRNGGTTVWFEVGLSPGRA
jgi:anti-sigma regulatory factor (Ser/Thr protein kinase)